MTGKGAALGVSGAPPYQLPTRAALAVVRTTSALNFNKIWIAILEILCLFVSLELNLGIACAASIVGGLVHHEVSLKEKGALLALLRCARKKRRQAKPCVATLVLRGAPAPLPTPTRATLKGRALRLALNL